MIVDMPREAKVGGGVWHEYILLLKKKKKLAVHTIFVVLLSGCQWQYSDSLIHP